MRLARAAGQFVWRHAAVSGIWAAAIRTSRSRAAGTERNVGSYTLTANAALRSVPRTVVEVDARDARGGHLTITQPNGSAFLSPVLLMQSTQTIYGLTLPFDSFALPGVHRIVKAVLFSQQEAASLPTLAAQGGAVVLFDMEDETGNELPHAIAIARDEQPARIQNVVLTPKILTYPAIMVAATPDLGRGDSGRCRRRRGDCS